MATSRKRLMHMYSTLDVISSHTYGTLYSCESKAVLGSSLIFGWADSDAHCTVVGLRRSLDHLRQLPKKCEASHVHTCAHAWGVGGYSCTPSQSLLLHVMRTGIRCCNRFPPPVVLQCKVCIKIKFANFLRLCLTNPEGGSLGSYSSKVQPWGYLPFLPNPGKGSNLEVDS